MQNAEIKQHPIYRNYGADRDGVVYNFKKLSRLHKHNDKYGYSYFNIRFGGISKSLRVGRFVFECFNGLIPGESNIDHINNVRDDNKITNLRAISHSDNIKKKYTGGYLNNHMKKGHGKHVEACNLDNNVLTYYNSIYGAGVALNIVPASVNRVCRGQQKTAISKDTNVKYSFKFVE